MGHKFKPVDIDNMLNKSIKDVKKTSTKDIADDLFHTYNDFIEDGKAAEEALELTAKKHNMSVDDTLKDIEEKHPGTVELATSEALKTKLTKRKYFTGTKKLKNVKLYEEFLINESQYTRVGQTDEQEEAIATIEKWVKKLGKSIVGADTIGKHPQTVILDLSHHGSEIYINTSGFEDKESENGLHIYPGVEVYGVHIPTDKDFEIFKKAIGTGGKGPQIEALLQELGQADNYYKDKQPQQSQPSVANTIAAEAPNL